ncbi:RNA 2',3'-cyclic phosphodiesterase [Phosphitispora sp. TUW77]|uniref:RNA 2',3'-cyclic phosphodiesterase n=1 Tax=Phosphitispora sp. TUW77 TaxID=3152361 RepID=UPI003AB8BCEC
MDKYRCFIAIDLPGDLKKDLARVQAEMRSWPVRVKWVEEQNFHLTLKFLGDIDRPFLKEISSSLEKVSLQHQKFSFSISGLGAYPSLSRPKVIWAGVRDNKKCLYRIWTDIESEMVKLGLPAEKRKFSPHLTLGRVKELMPAPGLDDILPGLPLGDREAVVSEIKLMRSTLSRSGPEYFCISSFTLQEHF